MMNCLWCDAPNEKYVDSFVLRRIYKDNEYPNEEQVEKVTKHPAGNFMLCAAILGANLVSSYLTPFYVTFFHRKSLSYHHFYILKHLTPDYEPAEYKLISKSAIIYSIPVVILSEKLSQKILA